MPDAGSTKIARLRVALRLLSLAGTPWRRKENVVLQKRMFKVLCPVEKKDGGTYWMRLGNAYTNKDESINVYLDAVPVGAKEVKLQLRELTEEDLRPRDEKRAQYAATRTANAPAQQSLDAVPF